MSEGTKQRPEYLGRVFRVSPASNAPWPPKAPPPLRPMAVLIVLARLAVKLMPFGETPSPVPPAPASESAALNLTSIL